jgi:Nif-specific regulatory protein
VDLRRGIREAGALYEIGKSLAHASDLNKTFTAALQTLALHLGLENGTLSLFDPVTGDVFIEAAPEMSDEERILGRQRPGEGVVGQIFSLGLPIVVPDIDKEPWFSSPRSPWREVVRSPRAFIGVPVRDRRAVLGVLTADRRHGTEDVAYDPDVRVLTTVASIIATRVRLMHLESGAAPDRLDSEQSVLPLEGFPGVIGKSGQMRDILALVSRVAKSRATVLIRGESGTGKEVIAHAVHDASPRAERPFVAVNCAAIPEALVESELFGHDKGAFTGAAGAHQGRFERADGGTLFLDEVGDLSLAAQAKLLRVVQERQFERVGGNKAITVDVRLVAATNRNLEHMVRAGTFRLDLYHRLSVVSIVLPPLRDRPEDIPALAHHFLGELAEEHGRVAELTPEGMAVLHRCHWAGNARQLRNCLERALVTSGSERLRAQDFGCGRPGVHVPCWLGDAATTATTVDDVSPAEPASPPAPRLPAVSGEASNSDTHPDERAQVLAALERSGYVQAKAARLLGMTVRQLGYRVRKYGIPLQRY